MNDSDQTPPAKPSFEHVAGRPAASAPVAVPVAAPTKRPKEIGGPQGPEPTRYGDWEQKGRCTDF